MKQPRIIEQFVLSKLGDVESCEDHIYISDKILAVLDGVTSKATNIPRGLKPGEIVAQEPSKDLFQLNSDADCSESLAYLSNGC